MFEIVCVCRLMYVCMSEFMYAYMYGCFVGCTYGCKYICIGLPVEILSKQQIFTERS